jgi:hypothetical protein
VRKGWLHIRRKRKKYGKCGQMSEEEDSEDDNDMFSPPQAGPYKYRGLRGRFIDKDGVGFETAQTTLHYLF